MHSAQLNSGSFKRYTPIGEDGSPVWRNAAAFRSAIERESKLGERYARFLAEPKFNENSDHVDWYVPFKPTRQDGDYLIVSWQSASRSEKSAALKQLSEFETKLLDFGYDLEARSLDSNNLLFAHYLTGRGHAENLPALHFPDESCLFIVDGQPVITYWGFVKDERSLQASPFASLRPKVGAIPPKGAAPAAAAAAGAAGSRGHLWCWLLPLLLLLLLLLLWWLWQRFFAPELPLFSVRPDLEHLSLEPVPETLLQDEQEQEKLKAELLRRQTFVTDGTAATVKGSTQLSSTDAVAADADSVPADATAVDAGKDAALTAADGELKDDTAQEALPQDGTQAEALEDPDSKALAAPEEAQKAAEDGTTPDQGAQEPAAEANKAASDNADGQDAQDAENAQNQAQDPQQQAAAQDGKAQSPTPPELDPSKAQSGQAHEDLQLKPQDLSGQNLKVLDGNWASRSGLVDGRTGRPVNVQYAFKDGKGTATVTRADGTKCVTQVQGSMQGGALNIDNAGTAKCQDGSGYNLPKVTCKPDKDGKTSCVGSYSDKEQVNMQLFR